MLKQKSKSKVRDAQSACRNALKPFFVLFFHSCCFIRHAATSPETNAHAQVRTDGATGLLIHRVVVSFRSNQGLSRSTVHCPAFLKKAKVSYVNPKTSGMSWCPANSVKICF